MLQGNGDFWLVPTKPKIVLFFKVSGSYNALQYILFYIKIQRDQAPIADLFSTKVAPSS